MVLVYLSFQVFEFKVVVFAICFEQSCSSLILYRYFFNTSGGKTFLIVCRIQENIGGHGPHKSWVHNSAF